MPVRDELPGLRARGGEPEARHHVVEALLEQAQQLVADDARPARGAHERALELPLAQPIEPLGPLLCPQLVAVLGPAPNGPAPVLSRWMRPARQRPLAGRPPLALELEVDALASLELSNGSARSPHDAAFRLS